MSTTLEAPAETPVEELPITLSDEAQQRLAEINPDPPPSEEGDAEVDQDDVDTDVTEEAATDWRAADDVREMAESLGLTPERLARVKSRDALDAAQLLHDERLAEMGRQLLGQQQPTQPEQVAANAQPTTASALPPSTPAPGDPLEAHLARLKALGEEYAGDAAGPAFTGLADYLRHQSSENAKLRDTVSKLEQFAGTLTAQMQQAQIIAQQEQSQNDFRQYVNALGQTELFGDATADKIPDAQFANLKQVWDQVVLLHAAESQRAGRHVPVTKGLVTRAFNSVFADHLTQKALADKNERLRTQAGKKLGGPTRKQRPSQPKPDLRKPASEDASFVAWVKERREHYERGDS